MENLLKDITQGGLQFTEKTGCEMKQRRKSKRIVKLKEKAKLKYKSPSKTCDQIVTQQSVLCKEKINHLALQCVNHIEVSNFFDTTFDKDYNNHRPALQMMSQITNQNPNQSLKILLSLDRTSTWQQDQHTTKHLEEYFQFVDYLNDQSSNKYLLKNCNGQEIMINSNCLFEPDSLFYQINTIDHIFMEKRNRFLGMLEEKEKKAQSIGSEIPVLTFLTKEILFIAQEYFQTKDALLKDYSLLLKNIESQVPCERIMFDVFVRLLIIKNLKNAFNEQPIDYLNYFAKLERTHQWPPRPPKPIKTIDQLKHFLTKRIPTSKPRKSKHLMTNCSACFGSYNEQANILKRCRCNLTIHSRCKLHCGRCEYLSLKNIQIEQCAICHENGKGLMLYRLRDHRFVHSFCLLTHNYWEVVNGVVVVKEKQLLAKLNEPGKQVCCFCKKDAQLFSNCVDCALPSHALCAYLQGRRLNFHEEHGQKATTHNCNLPQDVLTRLSYDRKYKLNYQNTAFAICKKQQIDHTI